MNKPTTCDPNRIELLLQQKLSDSEQADLESHLDQCAPCRRHLEATAAGADAWSEVRHSLLAEPLTVDYPRSSDFDSAANSGTLFNHRTVLDLLAPTDDDQSLGRLGTYEVVGVIGSGGMGVVLKALDPALNRYVAIKVLAPHLGGSGAGRRRFSREAQAAAAVVHDNVMEVHGVAGADALPYLVMPYVRGPSLQRRLDADGPLSLVEILRIAGQTASGLAAAHAQGLVHRDVKPANILLADGVERVKLTDFGLARAADDASLTKSGVIAGTPQFMSPEQARGDSVDQRSDLFSLGCVMYAMCTGRPPFRAETSYGVLRRITDDEPRPIREINPEVPEWLCRIIARLMSKQPDDRFGSGREVAQLLEDCLAHVQQPTVVPLPEEVSHAESSPVAGGRRWFMRRMLAGVALALTLLFAGVVVSLELDKGTLTIESNVDDVAVRIIQADEVVEKLTVTRAGRSVRVRSGTYVVEIEGKVDGIAVQNETVTLQRGGTEIVSIVRHSHAEIPAVGQFLKSSDWEIHKVINPAHSQGIWCVAFAPDGKVIASAASDKTVKLWDVATGRLNQTIERPVNCTSIAFSPDGTLLAIAGGDHGKDPPGEVVLWDLAAERVRAVLESHEGAKYSKCVAFSPTGEWLASGGNDDAVKIWNVQSGELHRNITDHSGLVHEVAFSPDGGTLASASFDKTVRLWRVPNGEAIATLRGHTKEVRGVAFSPDGNLLVSTSEDGTARVWDVASRESVGVMDAHQGKVFSVAFAPDGRHVVTGSRGNMGVLVWDVPTQSWQDHYVFPHQSSTITSLAYSPDSQLLAIAGGWNSFQIWKRRGSLRSPASRRIPTDREEYTTLVDEFADEPVKKVFRIDADHLDILDPGMPRSVEGVVGKDPSWPQRSRATRARHPDDLPAIPLQDTPPPPAPPEAESERIEPPEETLTPGTVTVQGVVLGPDKRPFRDADVRIYETFTRSERLFARGRSDAEGRFQFEGIPSERKGRWYYKVTISAPNFASRVVLSPSVSTSAEYEFEVELSEPHRLRGRVVGPNAEPVAGAEVYTPPFKAFVPGVHSATTDTNGYFEIADLMPWDSADGLGFDGGLSGDSSRPLRVFHPDFGKKLVSYRRVPSYVPVEFDKPMIVSGRVIDRGQPVQEARVAGGGVAATTDEEGHYQLTVQPRRTEKMTSLTITLLDDDDKPMGNRISLPAAPDIKVEAPFLWLPGDEANSGNGPSNADASVSRSPPTERETIRNLHGVWNLVSLTSNGKTPAGAAETGELTFEDHRFQLVLNRPDTAELQEGTSGSFSINPATEPAELNLFKDNFLIQAIYKLDGDELTLAFYGRSEVGRPRGFDDKHPDGQALVVLTFRRSAATEADAAAPKAAAANDEPLVIQLLSSPAGDLADIRVAGDWIGADVEALEAAVRAKAAVPLAEVQVRIEAHDRLPFSVLEQVVAVMQQAAVKSVTMAELPDDEDKKAPAGRPGGADEDSRQKAVRSKPGAAGE